MGQGEWGWTTCPCTALATHLPVLCCGALRCAELCSVVMLDESIVVLMQCFSLLRCTEPSWLASSVCC